MSGRWLTAILLLICVSMVLWALRQRSRDTGQVRQFWGASGAACIQRAPDVRLMRPAVERRSESAGALLWQDISHAPGLIHLRATLVDDRYYHWPSQTIELSAESASPAADSSVTNDSEAPSATTLSRAMAAVDANSLYRLRFQDGDERVDVALDVQSGQVINLSTRQSVRLIESSRRALDIYFQLPELTTQLGAADK